MKLTLTDNDDTVLGIWKDVENGVDIEDVDTIVLDTIVNHRIETKAGPWGSPWEVDENGNFSDSVNDKWSEEADIDNIWLLGRLEDLKIPEQMIIDKHWRWILRNVHICNNDLEENKLEDVTMGKVIEHLLNKIKF